MGLLSQYSDDTDHEIIIIMITMSRLVVDGQGQQLAPGCQNVETGWPVIPHHHHDYDNGNDNDDDDDDDDNDP